MWEVHSRAGSTKLLPEVSSPKCQAVLLRTFCLLASEALPFLAQSKSKCQIYEQLTDRPTSVTSADLCGPRKLNFFMMTVTGYWASLLFQMVDRNCCICLCSLLLKVPTRTYVDDCCLEAAVQDRCFPCQRSNKTLQVIHTTLEDDGGDFNSKVVSIDPVTLLWNKILLTINRLCSGRSWINRSLFSVRPLRTANVYSTYPSLPPLNSRIGCWNQKPPHFEVPVELVFTHRTVVVNGRLHVW